MKRKTYRTIVWGGLLCGALDITAAIIMYGLLRGRSPVSILQSVATGLLGSDSYEGGWVTAVLGLLLHFCIAFGAATVFYAASRKLRFLLSSPVLAGIVYGIAVYFFMSLVVVPLSASPHGISFTPWGLITGLTIHMLCVGLPISLAVSRFSSRREKPLQHSELSTSNVLPLLISTVLILTFVQTAASENTVKATFAGGCYWCMEEAFEQVEGVVSVTSGFMGEFSSGSKGHVEVVEVQYDLAKINYQKLLDVFWKNIDPTDADGQFCDRGPQYRSAILYHDQQQKAEAEQSKQAIQQTLNEHVVTPVIPAAEFKPAEEKHQDFYKKNAFEYKQYKMRCGRDRRLRALWK